MTGLYQGSDFLYHLKQGKTNGVQSRINLLKVGQIGLEVGQISPQVGQLKPKMQYFKPKGTKTKSRNKYWVSILSFFIVKNTLTPD